MSASTRLSVRVKRAYDAAAPSDGYRVLVDRVWPRGITKKELRIEAWLKELSPSTGLRKWFDHDPANWKEFKERYFRELDSQSEAVLSKAETITLLFGARDMRHNNAVALKEYLERHK